MLVPLELRRGISHFDKHMESRRTKKTDMKCKNRSSSEIHAGINKKTNEPVERKDRRKTKKINHKIYMWYARIISLRVREFVIIFIDIYFTHCGAGFMFFSFASFNVAIENIVMYA